jgi:hypothetical protein
LSNKIHLITVKVRRSVGLLYKPMVYLKLITENSLIHILELHSHKNITNCFVANQRNNTHMQELTVLNNIVLQKV